jgi:hypothetical protein
VMFFEVADHRLDGGAPFELALDLRRNTAPLAGRVNLELVIGRGVVATIAGVGDAAMLPTSACICGMTVASVGLHAHRPQSVIAEALVTLDRNERIRVMGKFERGRRGHGSVDPDVDQEFWLGKQGAPTMRYVIAIALACIAMATLRRRSAVLQGRTSSITASP